MMTVAQHSWIIGGHTIQHNVHDLPADWDPLSVCESDIVVDI